MICALAWIERYQPSGDRHGPSQNYSSFSAVITRFSPWDFFLRKPLGRSISHCLSPPQIITIYQQTPVSSHRVSQTSNSLISRWYLGLTEVFSILAGELMILIRINAVYGWSRKIVLLTLFLFGGELHVSSATFEINRIATRSGERGQSGLIMGTRAHLGMSDRPCYNHPFHSRRVHSSLGQYGNSYLYPKSSYYPRRKYINVVYINGCRLHLPRPHHPEGHGCCTSH
ncbi:hypothetical protein B0H17DRAFT_298363 [Mycena rosella]|uniref:Uncharacterized protein n=1 Tax=Mycena rosella TaxID=1033263 RepID=A0AAD7CVE5_MYCRO|nr:hypothetical protein B0H17DRAFT_298363 [Mycena rosella]